MSEFLDLSQHPTVYQRGLVSSSADAWTWGAWTDSESDVQRKTEGTLPAKALSPLLVSQESEKLNPPMPSQTKAETKADGALPQQFEDDSNSKRVNDTEAAR